MNDTLCMGHGQYVGDLPGQLQRRDQRQAPIPRLQTSTQALPTQVLHDQVGGSVGCMPKVRDLHNARMLKAA